MTRDRIGLWMAGSAILFAFVVQVFLFLFAGGRII